MNGSRKTANPPYYAVIFRSRLADTDLEAYETTATRMVELARTQPGFLGIESLRGENGVGVTISYWSDRESISRWGAVAEHRRAQRRGRDEFYAEYTLEICEVQEVRKMNK